MKIQKLALFLLVLFINFYCISTQENSTSSPEGAGVENDPTENDGNSTAILECFTCDETKECEQEQKVGNSSDNTCEAGQHCWTWKNENNGTVTYRRGCSSSCTNEEVYCKTTNNQTECSLCCTESHCNAGEVNSAISSIIGTSMWLCLVSTVVSVYFAHH